jgi:hypothetical protein
MPRRRWARGNSASRDRHTPTPPRKPDQVARKILAFLKEWLELLNALGFIGAHDEFI